MTFFNNSDPEEFLLFVINFTMSIQDLGILTASAKLQYLCTLLCGEALRKFDTFYDQLGSTNTAHVSRIVLDVDMYSFPVIMLSKQK